MCLYVCVVGAARELGPDAGLLAKKEKEREEQERLKAQAKRRQG